MASKEAGGGGGALGWTVLGFLAGVAATLALQTLLSGHERAALPEASITHATVIQAEPSTPKSASHVVKPESSQSAASVAVAASSTAPREDVADDAAAAGMTSRTQPQADDSASRN